ncbi:hypothetical protein Ga0100231_012395 [Opitutaceae bacterium TAV4]|nr:hypothetical protein Ga0100231_012395 [Opitutaceae bacterium TAV4]
MPRREASGFLLSSKTTQKLPRFRTQILLSIISSPPPLHAHCGTSLMGLVFPAGERLLDGTYGPFDIIPASSQ